MLNRYVPLVVCLTLLSAQAFAQNPQGIGYAVEFAASGSGQFQIYPENTASFATNSVGNTGPTGAPNQIVAKADGSKLYLLGTTAVQSIDPAFATTKTLNGLTGAFSNEQMTPDGRYLIASASQGSGSGTVYVINTTSDTASLSEPVSGTIIGTLVSRDSSTLWILGASSGTFITTINLNTMAQVGAPLFLRDPATGGALGGAATTFGMSPTGLLYVTAGNQILEIDPGILASCQTSPLTCSPTKVISVSATPGPLEFTPDGAFAYFLNQTPNIGGRSLYRMSLPDHNLISYNSQEVFDSLIVAGQTRIFAHSAADTTLWDVAPDLSTVTVSALQSVLPATQVVSAVISDELPSAQFLFVMAGGPTLSDVYMINLSTNTVSAQAAAALGLGPLQFIYIPSQAPAGFTSPLTYNATQVNLTAGSTAAPLIARVLDQNGNPVFNVPVTFTGDPTQTITPANTTTNADGFVQTTVKMGANPGPFPVTMTAGSGNNTVTATFALTIPGAPGTPGGPGGGGPNQLSIIGGNGQLFLANSQYFGTNNLLTVQLLDTNGNPLANYNVTFTITGPLIGGLSGGQTTTTTTDDNGMANTQFFAGFPPQNRAFEGTVVTAVATDSAGTQLGTVNFNETIYQLDSFNGGEPNANLKPSIVMIAGGEGDVIPNAFTVNVTTAGFGQGQAIPNIGVRIADGNNPTNNGPGTCQGNPLTDQFGNLTCNFIPACGIGIPAGGSQFLGFDIEVGEKWGYSPNSLTLTQGSTRTLTLAGGNNQNGNPGSSLSAPLTATVTDNCGTAIPGVTVTWKVTQGSATLSATSSVTVGNGAAQTKVTLGSSAGTVKVTASIAGSTVTYTETANAIVGSLVLTSGGGQSALEGVAFAQPVVFTLQDNKGSPLSGYTVNFSLSGSGSGALSTTTTTTNSNGQASVNVTAGTAPGTLTITATFSTFSQSASLTVTAPGPNVTATSFVSAASFQAGLVPCEIATVTGPGLAPGISGVFLGNTLGIGPLPYTLQGVSISVNGISSPLLSVSNQGGVQQVNFQVPCETPTGSNGTVVVQVNSAITTVRGVTVYPMQPGIFTYAGPGGLNYAAIISVSNDSYVTPSNPAHVGQTYLMVVTGMGQTSPSAVTNSPGTGSQFVPVSSVTLAINNVGVPVTSVQYVQGAVGEYFITFTIPAQANGQPFPTGNNLPISLGGITSTGQTIFDTAQVALPALQ